MQKEHHRRHQIAMLITTYCPYRLMMSSTVHVMASVMSETLEIYQTPVLENGQVITVMFNPFLYPDSHLEFSTKW